MIGDERLDARLTVMVSVRMLRAVESKSGGHVSEYVRRVLSRALSGQKSGKARKSKVSHRSVRGRRGNSRRV